MPYIAVIVIACALFTASWTVLIVWSIGSLIVIAFGVHVVMRLREKVGGRLDEKVIVDRDYVAALEQMVADAEAEIAAIREGAAGRSDRESVDGGDRIASAYRRVGLQRTAPEWLVRAAQKAYRSALHPDRHPVQFKVQAEQRFKAAEAAFDLIALHQKTSQSERSAG